MRLLLVSCGVVVASPVFDTIILARIVEVV